MANDLTEVIPKLLVMGLRALRENTITVRLVNRQYETTAGELGSTIDVPIPSAITAVQVAPANIAPNPGDLNPTSVPIPLDQWFEAAFQLSDKDMLEVQQDTIPMQASEAIKSLANNVDDFVLALYKDFFGFTGTPGTTPFSNGTTSDATDMRKILNEQLAPLPDRWAILDPDAEAEALNVRAFQDLSWNGSPDGIIEAQLNRKLGFGWWMNQNIPTHTSGTADDYTVTGVNVIGVTVLTVTSAANNGTFLKGDIITIAGDTQTYVITKDELGAPAPSITISPTLRVATSGGEAITVEASHVVNLGFHRDAIAFASRPLQRHNGPFGVVNSTAVDPVSGLALRVEVTHEFKRLRFSYDILYGAAVIRPQLGVRLAG